jgi:hypothetical protein
MDHRIIFIAVPLITIQQGAAGLKLNICNANSSRNLSRPLAGDPITIGWLSLLDTSDSRKVGTGSSEHLRRWGDGISELQINFTFVEFNDV